MDRKQLNELRKKVEKMAERSLELMMETGMEKEEAIREMERQFVDKYLSAQERLFNGSAYHFK